LAMLPDPLVSSGAGLQQIIGSEHVGCLDLVMFVNAGLRREPRVTAARDFLAGLLARYAGQGGRAMPRPRTSKQADRAPWSPLRRRFDAFLTRRRSIQPPCRTAVSRLAPSVSPFATAGARECQASRYFRTMS